MTQRHNFLIGKEWRERGQTIPVVNPHTQEAIAEVCLAGRDEILQAISLAERAFDKTRNLPAYLRSRICGQTAQGIRSRREEFARTIALESGKPLVFARAETDRAAATFEIAAEEAKRIGGEVLDLDVAEHARGKIGIARRFPIGPVAGISPFNFPLNLVAHKVAPALACGNPIVLKPSSTTPLSALLLGKVLMETEAVEGSLSILPCKSADAAPLVEDPRLKMVTFTGSAPVGWDIKRRAGKKKAVLELGGNAAVIVESDADLELAAKKICAGAFAFSGQVCISVQRAFVHESRFDRFMDLLRQEIGKLKIGDPLDETVTFGPMIDLENAERIEAWVGEAVRSGAQIVTGGKRKGALYEPTVLAGVDPAMKVSCQEAFGPILTVEPYADFQKAIDRVNDSDFGLQSGIFTNQMDKVMQAFDRFEVGGVIVNDAPTFRVDNMPYGGIKESGFGREGVRYSMEEMTEIKLLVLNNCKD
ncbi:MAG: aldehyde dehydrogenase family protein [Nitrospinae bacterium]|nr:aldehyde dehydrogenase family protein [Nitrospinota bacterium]